MNARRRSILVAVDASAGSRAALRQAAEFARRIDAELSGLFVEDENLLRLAGLPFARELPAGGGEWRPLSSETMTRDLARLARELEHEFEELGRQLEIPWRFHRRRGRVAAELLAASGDCELVVIGTAGMRGGPTRLGSTARRLLADADCAVMLIAPGAEARPATIAVVFDGSRGSEIALTRALELTPDERPLAILAAPEHRSGLATLKGRARAVAGERRVEFHSLPARSGAALLDAVAGLAPALLVLADTDWIDNQALERLIAKLDGGLVRIRTSA